MYRKTISILAILLGGVLMLGSCNQKGKNSLEETLQKEQVQYKKGLSILRKNCMSCHAPKEKGALVIAPGFPAIKEAYLKSDMMIVDFIKSMTAFMLRPSVESARMPEAVERYGLMPNLGMLKQQYDNVATYLLFADLDHPNWYEDFLLESTAQESEIDGDFVNYLQKGMDIAVATKAVLGKNLLSAIKTKGTAEALSFCNERAVVLTDSMSLEHNTRVKRVSDKNRNAINAANEMELAYIKHAHDVLASGGNIEPHVQELEGKMIIYYPILTNAMCLQCHGKPEEDIKPSTLSKLHMLYPQDKGVGYEENELRGIWVVEMEP